MATPSWLRDCIRDIPDHPEPGIVFRDLTPLLANAGSFARCVDELSSAVAAWRPEAIVGIEARGFWFGPVVARTLCAGFVPVRKPGKLPAEVVRRDYDLEYGTDAVELHADALGTGQRIAVIDDVIATGGTAAAVCELIESAGASVVGAAFVLELSALKGRERLVDRPVFSVGAL